MSQRDRAEFLNDLGYEEPYNESPIDTPDGWFGGCVENTGGNIMCRIWSTWEAGERARETEYEVIYDVSQDSTVALQAYTWDDKVGDYTFREILESQQATDQSDRAQAQVAKRLMSEYEKFAGD